MHQKRRIKDHDGPRDGRSTKESNLTKEWTQMQEDPLWEDREELIRLCYRKIHTGTNVNG